LEAGLEVEYARDSIGFHWAGCEEGDEVDGEGTAELLDDGTLRIEFEYRNGDEAVLKAKRDTSRWGGSPYHCPGVCDLRARLVPDNGDPQQFH
jgi:hypothetical protein